jgi:hypothetical protein
MRPWILLVCLLLVAGAPPHDPWVNLGYALPGTLGEPLLQVKGPLTPESVVDIELSNAKPFAKAYLVVGFSAIFAPYKGGILVPDFDMLVLYPTGEAGTVSIVSHFPPGAPSGFPIILQFWIDDEAGIQGRAGSNAMGALTP